MELNKWIENIGGVELAGKLSPAGIQAVASLLGEKPRTVLSWYRQERIPSFAAGCNIIIKSRKAVDWNGIYSPFAVNLLKVGKENAGA
ncbi:hypothetical protein [Pseudomonas sp. S5D5]|uniref:hypothetical protein n=1 Tax=Pseudomonas sp. S5D5 TaxID=2083056 RepID=UPI000D109CE4|nr:hypothetical protein [Pseudomonas sp. S5D5]